MAENKKNNEISRTEPKSLEAERAVLGSMLISKEAVPRAMTFLTEDCFYESTHKIIFGNIIQLFENKSVLLLACYLLF